jgi:hypothetical protein
VRLAAALLLVCGCDKVFGIDQIGRPADAVADVDCASLPDEDGDCVADSVDNCPVTPNPDQADRETPPDGVGDACDPHPTDPHDTILGFWSFLGDGAADMTAWPNEDPASTTWSYPGTGVIVHSALGDSVGEVLTQADYISSELTAEAGFTFHAFNGDNTSVEMSVRVDSPFGVGGLACFATPYNNNSASLDNLYVEDAGGNATSSSLPEMHDGDLVTLRIQRVAAPPTLQCHAVVNDTQVDTGVIPISVPAGANDHHVALQSRFTSAEVRYVVIYGRTL